MHLTVPNKDKKEVERRRRRIIIIIIIKRMKRHIERDAGPSQTLEDEQVPPRIVLMFCLSHMPTPTETQLPDLNERHGDQYE